MKKQVKVLCFVVCIVCLVLGCLTACQGKKGNGTYYRYKNGSYSTSDYITLDGDTWTDGSGASGPVERSGDRITLYIDLFGEKEIIWEGTCKNGVLTLTDGYDTEYFCQKGIVPPSENEQDETDGNGSNSNNGNNGGVVGDGPDVTLTFRTQGGKEINPITAPAGSSVTVPTPEYDGYIFKGWYLSSDYLPSEKFESATMPNKNTTLWAKWEKKPDEYKNDYLTATDFVKWNDSHYPFEGEKMMIRYTSDQYRPGSTYNLNTGIEAKSGYNILWYRDEECTVAIGTQRDEISYGNNIYYATIVDAKNGQFVEMYMINVYLRHDYTYTYYPYAPNFTLAGEMQACYTERVIEDDTTHAPQAPNNGYTFVRWVTENRYGDFAEYNYNTPADGNRSFYAEWQSVSLTVNTGENATLLAGDSTTVTFTPYSSSYISVIPTTETQVFNGYYVGNTCYFDENGQLVKPLPASALASLEARYGETSDKYLNYVAGSTASGYTVSLKLLPTYETKIVIPSTYKGRPVIALANYAFRNEKTLTGITIPASVTTVGTDAFYGCTGLSRVTLPTVAVSSVPKDNLQTVIINGGTSIPASAFSGCTTLTSVTIPTSVAVIESGAFSGCTALTTVNYTGSIADWCSITGLDYLMASGRALFIDGNQVTGVLVIPDGVTSISASAFRYCTGLTSVTIPASVTSIGSGAFSGCSSLRTLELPMTGATAQSDYSVQNDATYPFAYSNGVLCSTNKAHSTSSDRLFCSTTKRKSITIPRLTPHPVTVGAFLFLRHGKTIRSIPRMRSCCPKTGGWSFRLVFERNETRGKSARTPSQKKKSKSSPAGFGDAWSAADRKRHPLRGTLVGGGSATARGSETLQGRNAAEFFDQCLAVTLVERLA